jgi:hypothetical protein
VQTLFIAARFGFDLNRHVMDVAARLQHFGQRAAGGASALPHSATATRAARLASSPFTKYKYTS